MLKHLLWPIYWYAGQHNHQVAAGQTDLTMQQIAKVLARSPKWSAFYKVGECLVSIEASCSFFGDRRAPTVHGRFTVDCDTSMIRPDGELVTKNIMEDLSNLPDRDPTPPTFAEVLTWVRNIQEHLPEYTQVLSPEEYAANRDQRPGQ